MSRIGPSSSCPAQKLQVAMLRGSPAQRGGIHLARGYQVLDVVDPLEPRPLAILEHETDAAVGGIELLGAAPRVPLRLELGQEAPDLAEVYPIGPGARTTVLRILDARAGDDLLD